MTSFKPLETLYQKMDQAWDDIAGQYGFQCNGCEDNCCRSLFFHHTHVEKAFLVHGFSQLALPEKEKILNQAHAYIRNTFSQDSPDISQKIFCPLIRDGQCRLYRFRPMICRMHGLPHELHRPGFPVTQGKGCDAGRFDLKPYIPFDRTPFYREMAQVEMAFRTATGKTGKIRETIAQILASTRD